MIYFDDIYYTTHKNSGKTLNLKTATGKLYPVKLVENADRGLHYITADSGSEEDEVVLSAYDIEWYKKNVNANRPFYVAEEHVDAAKKEALNLDISLELNTCIKAISIYAKYYSTPGSFMNVYAIRDYDVRQENKSSVIIRFDQRYDPLGSTVIHKIQGIAPSREIDGQVFSTTVEAWRYKALTHDEIKAIAPEFYNALWMV